MYIRWLWVDTNPIWGAFALRFVDGFVSEFATCYYYYFYFHLFVDVSFFFFCQLRLLPWYVCLLAKLACQVKFKQILLEQLWLFMGKWLDPLTVSILNFYAFIFMTVILMKKHFKPPLKWRKYHSSTLTHRPRHRPRPSPSPRPELKLKLKLKLNLSAKLKSSQVKSRLMLIRCFFFSYSYLCTVGIHMHAYIFGI